MRSLVTKLKNARYHSRRQLPRLHAETPTQRIFIPCPAFTQRKKNHLSFQVCKPGTFANFAGSTKCTECQEGRFGSFSGQSACKFCEPGRHADVCLFVCCAHEIQIYTRALTFKEHLPVKPRQSCVKNAHFNTSLLSMDTLPVRFVNAWSWHIGCPRPLWDSLRASDWLREK